ncbi:hypothetical protein IAR55_000879 [Kwoniella newhampshirensis]|uniref:C3H1-type domain-containing protein n=1 Tax=Kwoniella newhampshirensis TaxID=1651941 RepID=A0AAW0Z4A9_9TREE
MNSRQPFPLPPHPSLPSRPAFPPTSTASGTAGPSPSRPSYQQQQQQYSYVPQPQTSYYPPQPSPLTSYNTNYTGGYQTSGGYQASGGYQTAPLYPAQPFYSPLAGGPSFGQSLFQPRPVTTPDGYAFSSTYLNNHPFPSSSSGTSQPPLTKKQRPNQPPLVADLTTMASGGDSFKPWRNCSHPGCKFVGSGEDVEIHEGDRHLIFPAGRVVERSEEEERFATRKGPLPPIQGTNITLDTPEQIEKWIAERKAKWPSSRRMQEKAEERKAAIARGEFPSRGGRGRGGRGGMGGRNDAAFMAEEWGREAKPRPAATDDGQAGGGHGRWDRGRGRGRGRGREERGRGRGRGTGRGGYTGEGRTLDRGWGRGDAPVSTDEASRPSFVGPTSPSADIKEKETNALAALGDYDTPSSEDGSESAETESDSSSDTTSDSDSDSDSDSASEVKSEHGTKLLPGSIPAIASAPETAVKDHISGTPSRPICKFYAASGRCKFGDRCRFAHTKSNGTTVTGAGGTHGDDVEKKKASRQPQIKKHNNPFSRPSLLGSLLANPIQNTLSQLSQTIRFLVANDMLDGVELKPGDAEAEGKERNKVVEVVQDDGSDVVKGQEDQVQEIKMDVDIGDAEL